MPAVKAKQPETSMQKAMNKSMGRFAEHLPEAEAMSPALMLSWIQWVYCEGYMDGYSDRKGETCVR